MTEKIPKIVWDRAKANFESEGRKDVIWGRATYDGKQSYEFTESEGPNSPTIVLMPEDMRKIYLDRAREELKAEGKL